MMSTVAEDQEPIAAGADERDDLEQLDRLLESRPAGIPALVGPDGQRIPLPLSVFRVLRLVVQALIDGEAVAVAPVPKELTTQQAADLLNVSRPHLIRLLERGEIPFHKTGTHRRIRFGDLMAYRRARERAGRQALARLTQLSEELSLDERR